MNIQDAIVHRRSINFFDPDKPVPTALLDQVIALAALSPSSFNLQPWSLIVVSSAEEKKILRSLSWDQTKVTEAPVVLIVLGDRDAWTEGHPFVERNFQEMIKAGATKTEQREWFKNARMALYGKNQETRQAFACKNTGFFAMSLMLAAKGLGLETHPMDGFDHDGVRKAFNIPDAYWIPLLICLGYKHPDAVIAPPKWRKSAQEIIVNFKS